MNNLGYVAAYYAHLFTLTGGDLRVTSSVVPLWGSKVYQIRVASRWAGREYEGAYRMDARTAVSSKSWGDPDHPLVYQTALLLRELCRSLSDHGCEYAIPQGVT